MTINLPTLLVFLVLTSGSLFAKRKLAGKPAPIPAERELDEDSSDSSDSESSEIEPTPPTPAQRRNIPTRRPTPAPHKAPAPNDDSDSSE